MNDELLLLFNNTVSKAVESASDARKAREEFTKGYNGGFIANEVLSHLFNSAIELMAQGASLETATFFMAGCELISGKAQEEVLDTARVMTETAVKMLDNYNEVI